MGEHKHKKDHKSKSDRHDKKHKKKSSSSSSSSKRREKEMDYSDPSLWVEAEGTTEATPAEYLKNQQQVQEPSSEQVESYPKEQEARHGWMLDGSFDFGGMGTKREREEDKPKPNPDELKVSKRELNKYLVQGIKVDDIPEEKKPAIKFGDAGSNWRMLKLKNVRNQAEDDGRSEREVGIERFGSLEKYQEALDERAYLDGKRGRSSDRRDERRDQGRRYMFTDTSRGKFKRPNQEREERDDNKRQARETPSSHRDRREPAPPQQAVAAITKTQPTILPSVIPTTPSLSRDQLNKLNAKVVKAKMMGLPNAEELEQQYNEELERFENGQDSNVTVLPTMDSHGRMYDYALKTGEQAPVKGKKKYEGTHDKLTGERIRYGTADDALSLSDMVRQERANKDSSMDLEFANRIVGDATFENDLDYMDEKADIMAAKKGASEEQKMRRAVSDYKRNQETLDRCKFCYHDGRQPQLAMISLGTQVYLALPNVHELTQGNCLIVPVQHVSSTLECDDDVWTEIRNFKKCLMKMFHEQGKGVVFMETVTNIRAHRHAVIEAIPLPYGEYEDAPAYFKEAIMVSGEEWSQHKKLIDTSERGFRNSIVKNLPYFHVWFGLDKGYGHVIENAKEFPYWFGKEVIAGMLDLGPELWRKPKYYHASENHQRQQAFRKNWEKWDWTAAL
ncbi:hypothetical protein K501DRAFT_336113 [Backusella circina FSU 941]|nr:hypothetical protein K501DRAFT_336113 [Backusella circina FSU 941]